MAAALPVIAIAAAAGGQIMGGIEQNNAARSAARVDDENARRTILSGEYDALQTRKDERRMSGALLASMGEAGVDIGSGSSADIIGQNAYQRELEILNIRRKATTDADNLYQAGKDKRKAGHSALVQSMFGAVSSAIGGISDMRAQRAQAGTRAGERQQLGGGSQSWYVPPMRVKG